MTSEDESPEARLAFDREKWAAERDLLVRELVLKERDQISSDAEIGLRRVELARSGWSNPLTVAILVAAIAGFGNAYVTMVNGRLQRNLEQEKDSQQRILEESKAESARILEVIKVGDPDKAATNIKFLLQARLIKSDDLVKRLQSYLNDRDKGTGASLPVDAGGGQ